MCSIYITDGPQCVGKLTDTQKQTLSKMYLHRCWTCWIYFCYCRQSVHVCKVIWWAASNLSVASCLVVNLCLFSQYTLNNMALGTGTCLKKLQDDCRTRFLQVWNFFSHFPDFSMTVGTLNNFWNTDCESSTCLVFFSNCPGNLPRLHNLSKSRFVLCNGEVQLV